MNRTEARIVSQEAMENYVEMAALLTGASIETADCVVGAFNMLVTSIPAEVTNVALATLKEGIKDVDTNEEC